MDSLNTISCLQEGDQEAFERVFYEYHERVHAYVLHKTHSSYIADETLQLSFIKLWNYRHSLTEDLPLLSQVFRIVRTTMIDVIRKEQAKVHSLPDWKHRSGFTEDAGQKLEESELQRKLSRLLREMPGMQKKVFEMSRFEGMSYRDIATTLSISVKTVETHISRALKYLRQHLSFLVLLAAGIL